MSLNTKVSRRLFTASIATLVVAATPLFGAISQAAVVLNGAGATFPAPLYTRYIREFQTQNPGIRINYQAIGSGGGVRQIQAGSVDFGGSDSAMTDEQMDKVHQSRGVLMLPTAGGAVSVVYNVPGVQPGLKLTQAAVGEIFAGKITQWNDPAIAQANPGVNLPAQPIRLVVRADSSGTTFIFTNALSAMSSFFRGKVGVGTAPKWAARPLQGKGNPGVAAEVQKTPNSIGYVEYAFATENNMNMAAVQNKKGEFVMPSLEETKVALSNIRFPNNFRVFEGNPADGYPIAGLTWLLVYRQYDNAEKLDALRKWVRWVLTDGQKINPTINYVQIPEAVAQRALQTFESEVKLR